ncbi:MAG: protein phosphatase 2C domain-containing protein [Pseudomonadota bacterium]
MNWEIETNVHIGGREEQEDSVATFSKGNRHLLVVADGMGGHEGGRFASKTVIAVAKLVWEQETVKTAKKFLQRICDLAHESINDYGKKSNRFPHSTCILLYIHGKRAWWAHLGDSRLYHFRRRKLLQRTRDHSIVQLLVDLGRVKEEDMAKHPDQSHLFKCLGSEEPSKPDFGQASVRPGDSFVLCSDGFWEHVSASTMSKMLLRSDVDLRTRVECLVNEALEAGGIEGDNIGVAVAHLKGKNYIWFYAALGFLITVIFGGGVWCLM